MHLQSFLTSHIDVQIVGDNEELVWRFTGFYGHLVKSLHSQSWDLLRELVWDNALSWIVMGDFNEVLFTYEKQGGHLCDERNMVAFKALMNEYDLFDVGNQGP